jgi:hypothetical protein
MKTAVIGLAFLALTPTAARADFNIDGFTAGMTKTEALAKLRAEGLVPKPPLVPELSDGHEFETGPYTFFFLQKRSPCNSFEDDHRQRVQRQAARDT